MMKIVSAVFAFVALSTVGCAPRVTGATAMHLGGDVPVFWAYVTAEDPDKSGIYRCAVDHEGKPACKRAKMLAPCTRDRCGE